MKTSFMTLGPGLKFYMDTSQGFHCLPADMILICHDLYSRMLMGVSHLYLFQYNGKYFIPKPDIAVVHLSQVRYCHFIGI